MKDRAEEVMELYEEATRHFKKAVIMFAMSIVASLGAIFYFRKWAS